MQWQRQRAMYTQTLIARCSGIAMKEKNGLHACRNDGGWLATPSEAQNRWRGVVASRKRGRPMPIVDFRSFIESIEEEEEWTTAAAAHNDDNKAEQQL